MVVCSLRRACALQDTGFAAPSADPFLQSPPEPLLWQIPFGLTGPRGGAVGAAWQSPPISHIRSNLQSAVGGSLSPAPQQAAPVPRHCLQGSGAFLQLTCPRVERCEKLETKMVSTERVRGFLTQKRRKYLCGILFSPTPFIQKIQRDSVFNANVGFKSFRFGLTLQKKKKI